MGYLKIRTAIPVAIAVAVAIAPGAAFAKAKPKPKPAAITKSQVIALIKQYSKPGATGAPGAKGATGTTGATGANGAAGTAGQTGAPGTPATNWTLATNSGLTIGAGNTIGLLPTLTTPCPAHESIYYLDPQSTGLAWCSFTTQGQFTTGGFTSGQPGAAPADTVTSTGSAIAHEAINYAPGNHPYLVTAVAEFISLSSQIATCSLIDTTSNTTLETEEDTVNGYSNLSFLATPAITSGDNLEVYCTATGTIGAEATLASIPLG
jgi:hypothetical protein